MVGDPVVIFKPIIRDKIGEVKDTEYFQREIISNFFQKDIVYDRGVVDRRDQWMNFARVFPLISLMYKVSLASFGGNASPDIGTLSYSNMMQLTVMFFLRRITVIRGCYPFMIHFLLLSITCCILNMLENTYKDKENIINIHPNYMLTKT